MERKSFLSSQELKDLHIISLDFCAYLQEKQNESEQYDLKDQKIDQGVNLGVRSVLLLLSGLLVNEKGLLDKEKIQGLKDNLKNKEQGKVY